jgi:hypothetical protein
MPRIRKEKSRNQTFQKFGLFLSLFYPAALLPLRLSGRIFGQLATLKMISLWLFTNNLDMYDCTVCLQQVQQCTKYKNYFRRLFS